MTVTVNVRVPAEIFERVRNLARKGPVPMATQTKLALLLQEKLDEEERKGGA